MVRPFQVGVTPSSVITSRCQLSPLRVIDVNFVITMRLTLSDWSRSTVDLFGRNRSPCFMLLAVEGLTQYYDDYAGRLLLVMGVSRSCFTSFTV